MSRFDVEALEAECRRKDAEVRAQVARFEARDRATQAYIAITVQIYAQALGACWYLALNPNLGRAPDSSLSS